MWGTINPYSAINIYHYHIIYMHLTELCKQHYANYIMLFA